MADLLQSIVDAVSPSTEEAVAPAQPEDSPVAQTSDTSTATTQDASPVVDQSQAQESLPAADAEATAPVVAGADQTSNASATTQDASPTVVDQSQAQESQPAADTAADAAPADVQQTAEEPAPASEVATPVQEPVSAEASDEIEENRTYYVIDGAPLLVRASDKPHKILGAVTLGSAGNDVSVAGKLVVPDAESVVTASGEPIFGTSGAGQIPFEQDGKLVGLAPTEAGQVLTLVKNETTGALLPSWKPFELPAPSAAPKRLFLSKDADQTVDRLVQTTVAGWAAPLVGKSYRNDFEFDEAGGILSLDGAADSSVSLDVYFQATVQAASPSGSVTASVLVDQGQGFETVAEQTFRPGPSVVYPFSVSVSAGPTLAPGHKLQVSLWHDSSASVVIVGGPSTTLSVRE